MNSLNDVGTLVGRILMAAIFLLSGMNKFAHPAMMAGYMTSMGVPAAVPLLYLSAIIELAGGLMILVGFHARAAALLLSLWLIPVTIMMHAVPGGQLNQVEVMKNLRIAESKCPPMLEHAEVDSDRVVVVQPAEVVLVDELPRAVQRRRVAQVLAGERHPGLQAG